MREIIPLHIGQTGIRVGTQFWEMIAEEHSISPDSGKIEKKLEYSHYPQVYFQELIKDKFKPRAIFADLDPIPCETILTSQMGRFLPTEKIHFTQNSGCGNWAKGYFSMNIIEEIIDSITSTLEECDSPEAFQLIHSTSGATGGGLSTKILEYLKDYVPNILINNLSIVTDLETPYGAIDSLNSILSIDSLLTTSNIVQITMNNAVERICKKNLHYENVSVIDINRIISGSICGLTTSQRFGGSLNNSLRKLVQNVIPFPKLHFITHSFFPLVQRNQEEFLQNDEITSIQELPSKDWIFSNYNPKNGRYIAGAYLFAGKVSQYKIESKISEWKNNYSTYFPEWLPNNFLISISQSYPLHLGIKCAFLGNSTEFEGYLGRLVHEAEMSYRKRSFIHHFLIEGLEEGHLINSFANCIDLVAEYQGCRDTTGESWIEDEEYEVDSV